MKNLVARGEQKPATGSSTGVATTSPSYDTSNHAVLSNPLDPTGDGQPDFNYPGAHMPGEY